MTSIHSHPPSQSPAQEPVPASPTLTNPDMILPYSGISTHIYAQSPPFSSLDVSTTPTKATPVGKLGSKPNDAKTHLEVLTGFPASQVLGGGYEHGAPLSDIGEEDSIYRASRLGSGTVTPQDARSVASFTDDTRSDGSDDSASTISAASDVHRWKDFDSKPYLAQEKTADKYRDAPAGALAVPLADTRRSSFASLGDGDAESNALSERAERILANAKRRLSTLEGNLTRARSSLLLSPSRVTSPLGEHQEVGGLYRSISQSGERKYGPLTSPRPRAMVSNPQLSNHNHNRVLSETSVTPQTSYNRSEEVRSASALEHGHSRSIDNVVQKSHRFPIAVSTQKSPPSGPLYTSSPLHAVKEDDSISTGGNETPTGLGISNTSSSGSPDSRTAKAVSPDGSSRSPSQASTRELREQMNDLKSKISNLRVQTKVDSLRRRSMQNLRNPSPFTAAEGWDETEKQRPSTSHYNRSSGNQPKLPVSQRPLSRQKAFANLHAPIADRTPQKPTVEQAFETPKHMYDGTPIKQTPPIGESNYADASEDFEDGEDEPSAEEQIYLNEALEESLREGDVLANPIADVEEPEPERHEDRPDAFDYEHFILHSALGSYTRDGPDNRRDSATSFGSVETTRKYESPTPEAESGDETSDETVIADDSAQKSSTPEKRPPLGHNRKSSLDSVSTMATFATATEGNGSEQEDDSMPDDILNWGGNQYQPHPSQPAGMQHARSGALPTPPTMSPSEQSQGHKIHSLDEMTRSLMSFANPHHQKQEIALGLAKLDTADRELLEDLIQALGTFCSDVSQKISNDSAGQYDRKIWRRRMDAARMVLDGEVDIDPA